MKILDGNAFKLRITCEQNVEDYKATTDMSQVESLLVNFVRRGRITQTSGVDSAGRIVASNSGNLAIGIYGVELTGYYNGAPWRFYADDVFEIINDENEVSESVIDEGVPIYDVTFTLSLGGSADISFVDSAIINHNDNEFAHGDIRRKLGDKIDDILVDDESVVVTDPVTGKKEVKFDSDNFGKVDDVKVNGTSVVSQKVANIPVPTKTSELQNDSDFVNENDMQSALDEKQDKIDTVNLDYQEDGGSPSASATFEDGELDISMKNMKMKFSELTTEEKEEITGPQGPQGASAVFDPETGNILATLHNTTGYDDANAMTQKAVTEEFTLYDNINLDNTNVIYVTLENRVISQTTNKWAIVQSPKQTTVKIVKVTPGKIIALKPTLVYEGAVLYYTFLKSVDYTQEQSAANQYATGYSAIVTLPAQTLREIVVPEDAKYLYIQTSTNNTTRVPNVCAYVTRAKENIIAAGNEIAVIRDLTTENLTNLPLLNYSMLSSTGKFGTIDTSKHTCIKVNAGEKYRVQAPLGNVAVVVFATSNAYESGGDVPILPGTEFMVTGNSEEVEYTIPLGCKYLLIYNGGNARPFTARCVKKHREIHPESSFGFIQSTTGDFAWTDNTSKAVFESAGASVTPRFIKCRDKFYIIPNQSCTHIRVFFYDADYNYLGYQQYLEPNAGDYVEVSADYNYSYVKITSRFYEIPPQEMHLTLIGDFPEDWDTFNVRPSNGLKKISVIVNVSNPASCNDESQTIQDEKEYLPNYGMIALPPTYTNNGKPTRLIIYCHGAGTRFNINSSGFNANEHVAPTYWLKEGYAVMDVDGQPFDNTHYHAFIPQAMDCYVAAYKWAIEHYNLCRDGVFVGGRSMGGGTTLMFAHRQCPIPVIAACPNLPTSLAMNRYATHKEFGAIHRGYVLPDGFTWTDGADDQHPYTETEKLVVLANWDKFITNPVAALIIDLPTDAQWKIDFLNSCTLNNNDRITLMENLHMVSKCPIKMFGCNQDPNNTPETTIRLYKKMLNNSGQIAEMRMFNSYKDYTGTGYTAHYYELQDPALRTTEITRYGEEVSNVPMVYVEMLQFWRRYEQNN